MNIPSEALGNVQLPSGICSTTLGNVQLPPWICLTTLGNVQLPSGICLTTLGYVQLPSGICSTTLGDVQLPSGICLTTLGYVQLPSGVCSTTLGSMFNYPQEYVQLSQGSIFKYPRIFGNIIKSKCFERCCLKKVRNSSCENAGEVFARCFFDFLWDASHETPTFETIFRRPWSETGLKSRRFVRGGATKVNKNILRERRPEPKVTTL